MKKTKIKQKNNGNGKPPFQRYALTALLIMQVLSHFGDKNPILPGIGTGCNSKLVAQITAESASLA